MGPVNAELATLAGPDTSGGLPWHPLVVHAATVLLPLSLAALVVAILVPRLRARLAGLSVLGVGAGAVAAWFAGESGEALAAEVGVSKVHQQYGEALPMLAVSALALGMLWWRLVCPSTPGRMPPWAGRALSVLVVIVAAATCAVTVAAGHSGAVSVWASARTTPAADAPAPTGGEATGRGSSQASPDGAGGPLTLAEVAKHNGGTSCWSVVDGQVYDVTRWVSQHPGGAGSITAMCGADASGAYRGKHATDPGPAEALAGFRIGPLEPSGTSTSAGTGAVRPPAPEAGYTRADVAKHATARSCWSIVGGKVYDLTPWIGRHPGGAEAITEMCGGDGGGQYSEEHSGDADAATTLRGYQIGVLR
ncbi:MAG: cytochrome b5 domain-containing protein [Tetrasphaera sp.]